ncbi:hypothetical protein XF35_40065 [Streptomyces platensis subsp. clarensis]|nr:hypothetical protein [Streptomyces showdoensis]MCW7991238.1 hypothetical protein [Streptomyces platensis subsp. clarensis]
MTMLDEQSVKRLAYIRMLYEQGVSQARQPLPMGSSSLLSLHDAVEMFLVLTCDVRSVPVDKNTTFLDYFKKAKDLSGAAGMRRLNDARNGLKHAAGLPSADTVEQAVRDTFAFFDDNVPRVFDAPLWSVDTSYVIPQEEVRKWVSRASERFEADQGGAGLALLQLALLTTLRDPSWPYGSLLSKISRRETHLRKLSGTFRKIFDRSNFHVGEFSGQLDRLDDTVGALQDAMQWLVLGGSLHHYARFQALTPRNIFWGGDHEDEAAMERVLTSRDVVGRKPTREEFEFCRQFVVTTSLRKADIDAHVVPPSWRASDGG